VAMAALDAAQFKDVDTTDCRLVNFPAAGKNRPGCDEYHIGRSSLLRSHWMHPDLMWGQIEKA
jgi:hypothetical protein